MPLFLAVLTLLFLGAVFFTISPILSVLRQLIPANLSAFLSFFQRRFFGQFLRKKAAKTFQKLAKSQIQSATFRPHFSQLGSQSLMSKFLPQNERLVNAYFLPLFGHQFAVVSERCQQGAFARGLTVLERVIFPTRHAACITSPRVQHQRAISLEDVSSLSCETVDTKSQYNESCDCEKKPTV